MTFKALIAAVGLTALSIAGLAPQAEAKTRVTIGIGVGGPFGYGDCDYSLIFHDCYDGRWPGYGFHRHYYRPYYGRPNFFDDERYYVGPQRMSCNTAIRSLRMKGYSRIVALDCSGNRYSFKARRSGHAYKINVNAVTGYSSRNRL
jgi:hypothetical protein